MSSRGGFSKLERELRAMPGLAQLVQVGAEWQNNEDVPLNGMTGANQRNAAGEGEFWDKGRVAVREAVDYRLLFNSQHKSLLHCPPLHLSHPVFTWHIRQSLSNPCTWVVRCLHMLICIYFLHVCEREKKQVHCDFSVFSVIWLTNMKEHNFFKKDICIHIYHDDNQWYMKQTMHQATG